MMRIKRKCRAHDEGFTLVELIICMAIIVILTGLATVTVTMIHSARAKEAAVTLESEISDLAIKSKSQLCVVGGVTMPDYMHCIKVYRDTDGKFYIQEGYYDSTAASVAAGYISGGSELNVNNGKGVTMSSRVTIKYTDDAGTTKNISDSDDADNVSAVYIVYNKSGRCISGYGSFRFYKKNGNFISAVTIQKNGSHQSD